MMFKSITEKFFDKLDLKLMKIRKNCQTYYFNFLRLIKYEIENILKI
jgi:hypothetical protein